MSPRQTGGPSGRGDVKAKLRQEARAKVRDAILDATRELFAEGGLAAISMRRVAAQVGYSPRTIYLHFADKDDLLSELIEVEVGRLADRLEVALASEEDPREGLLSVARAYVRFALDRPHAYEAIFLIRSHPFSREAATAKQHVQGKRMLDALAAAVQASGPPPDGAGKEERVQAFRCALHGVASIVALGRDLGGISWETLVTQMVHRIATGEPRGG